MKFILTQNSPIKGWEEIGKGLALYLPRIWFSPLQLASQCPHLHCSIDSPDSSFPYSLLLLCHRSSPALLSAPWLFPLYFLSLPSGVDVLLFKNNPDVYTGLPVARRWPSLNRSPSFVSGDLADHWPVVRPTLDRGKINYWGSRWCWCVYICVVLRQIVWLRWVRK